MKIKSRGETPTRKGLVGRYHPHNWVIFPSNFAFRQVKFHYLAPIQCLQHYITQTMTLLV